MLHSFYCRSDNTRLVAIKFRILNRPALMYGWKMRLWFACIKLYGVNVEGSLNHTEFKEEVVIFFSPFTTFTTSTISSPPTIPSQNTWNVSSKRRLQSGFCASRLPAAASTCTVANAENQVKSVHHTQGKIWRHVNKLLASQIVLQRREIQGEKKKPWFLVFSEDV